MSSRASTLLQAMAIGAVVALLGVVPSDAQVWGRRGFSWQPEIQLARDELARLQADLDRMPLEEWRSSALAWLQLECPAETRVNVTESWRVGELVFKNKARVSALGYERPPSTWEIVFDDKPQRKIGLVMTDTDATKVVCPLGEVLGDGGALGVFQHGGVLLCLARQPEADEISRLDSDSPKR